MDNSSDKNKENKDLICLSNRLIFHSVIFALIFISHIIIFFTIYWTVDLIKILFFSFSFIGVVYILISIIPLILIKIKKLQTRIKHFKIASKLLVFFSFLIGIFFFNIIVIDTILVRNFCLECPFNLPFSYFVSHFDENFENKEEYELKRNCEERRCIFNNYYENSEYPYAYLCNYNPKEEFEEEDGENKLINCILLEPLYRNLYFIDEIIYNYLDKCYNLTNFYYCGRKLEPKNYEIEEDEKCPKKNYIYSMYFLCAYILIFDVIINLIIWYIQMNSYNLLSRINFEVDNTINIYNKSTNNNNQNESKNNNGNNNNNSANKNNQNERPILINNNHNGNKDNQSDNKIIPKKENNNEQTDNTNINNNENNNNSQNNNKKIDPMKTRGSTVLKPNHNTVLKSTVVLLVSKNENINNKVEKNNNNNENNENSKKDSDRNNENNCKVNSALLNKKYTTNSDIQFIQQINKSLISNS